MVLNFTTLSEVLHGVMSEVEVIDSTEPIFSNIPKRFGACHYHSWVVNPEKIGPELTVTALNDQGLVMGLKHKEYDVHGVQFHPEFNFD